jgi:MFS family permease
MALASVVGTHLFARLSDRVGRRRSMMLALAVMAVGALGVTLDRVVVVFAAIALFGMASFSFPVLAAAYVRDHTEARAFAGAFGAMTIIYSAGGLTGPYLFGRVSESAGFTEAYLMVAGVALLGLALIARIPATGRAADAGAALASR